MPVAVQVEAILALEIEADPGPHLPKKLGELFGECHG